MPEISVLMSVYNCENYLTDAMNSILNQTFKDFELIVVNDGSTDNSVEMIERYKDKRIKLFSFNKNQGISKALNFGISKCNGKYIAKADADDIYMLDRFEKQKAVLDNSLDISVVGSQIEYFPHNKEVELGNRYRSKKKYFEAQLNDTLNTEEIQERMYMFWCVTHSLMMIRGDIIRKFGYDESYEIAEDYKLLYDLNKKEYKMINIAEKLGMIRVSKDSTSVQRKDKLYNALFRIKQEEVSKLFTSPVYIWGAGGYGLGIKKEIEKKGYNIAGFIDSSASKIGTELEGVQIYSPEILKENKVKVISASDPGRFEIVNYLKSIGYIHLKDFVVF